MSSLDVAKTIQQQIGGPAFVMMGAKNLMSTGSGPDEAGGLCWKIGRNAKGVTHVKVSLDGMDLYTVRFIKQHRAPSFEVETLAEDTGVYFDQLHKMIEAGTGMYLSL